MKKKSVTIEVGDYEMDSLLVALVQRRDRLTEEGTGAAYWEIGQVLEPLIRKVEQARELRFEGVAS